MSPRRRVPSPRICAARGATSSSTNTNTSKHSRMSTVVHKQSTRHVTDPLPAARAQIPSNHPPPARDLSPARHRVATPRWQLPAARTLREPPMSSAASAFLMSAVYLSRDAVRFAYAERRPARGMHMRM